MRPNFLQNGTLKPWRDFQDEKYHLNKRFTHETEKDKTENVFLGMTKLGKTKLGIRFAENLFYEIPTFMAKTRISKYEKFKN